MGRHPENPYLTALREFPRRLANAVRHYEAQKEVDLDWNDLAAMVGMTTSVMSEVKLGKRPPRLEEVVRFAVVLGVRPEWLAFDSGPMQGMTADEMQQRTTVVIPTVTKAPSDVVKKRHA